MLGALILAAALGPPAPAIVERRIPFTARRKAEMVRYSKRHYGQATYRLTHPHVIVEHVSEAPNEQADYNTFAADTPDPELHELPNVCAHFIVDRNGAIYQMVSVTIRCRHTVGLNWTAIGIEHTGYTDGDVMGDSRQLAASLKLTMWLRCRFGIAVKDVIGHNESLSSPYHHELVPSLRRQTHGDMRHATMVRYRRALQHLGACSARPAR